MAQIQEFLAFYGTWRFITMFTTAHHWPLKNSYVHFPNVHVIPKNPSKFWALCNIPQIAQFFLKVVTPRPPPPPPQVVWLPFLCPYQEAISSISNLRTCHPASSNSLNMSKIFPIYCNGNSKKTTKTSIWSKIQIIDYLKTIHANYQRVLFKPSPRS
jgi:hypothetical protein